DFVRHYRLPPEKVMVVPMPSPAMTYREPTPAEVDALARRIGFQNFIFYPAQTWPHKNHLRLLEALKLLKDRAGIVVPLVSTGRLTHFFTEIEARSAALGLQDQVRFLGFVSEPEMRALYQLCTALVMPTRFEAASLPIWEAFHAG